MIDKNSAPQKKAKLPNLLRWALVVGFVIAAALTSALTFIAVRDFVATWRITDLPGVSLQEATSTPDASGVITDPSAPLQPVGAPTPLPWDGASRVSVLVMGLDYRDWTAGEGPPRTDTMILFTIDPLAQSAGMISIPRDLWVTIPGFQYGKINTAYQLGEGAKLPGGGPALAMKTVQELLGVPIQYYAQIDFNAFVRFIDEIGGVKIEVTEPITIDLLGDNTFKKLKPGVQVLPGELALAYARARKTEGGDFDRAQRQQQVVMGIRQRILEFDMLPNLIAKAPTLYQELSSGVNTNLNLDQAIRLAWMAQQIPDDRIRKAIIGTEQVNFFKTQDGLDALKPLPDQIRLLRDQVFTETGPASPIASNLPLVELMKAEGARVSVLNGSATAGLAARTADYLIAQGVNVTTTGNAESLYNSTTIIDYTGKPYTLKYLMELMAVAPEHLFGRYDPASQVDVTIIVGVDWGTTNTMP